MADDLLPCDPVAYRWEEWSALVGAWRDRLTFERPDDHKNVRKVVALYDTPQPDAVRGRDATRSDIVEAINENVQANIHFDLIGVDQAADAILALIGGGSGALQASPSVPTATVVRSPPK